MLSLFSEDILFHVRSFLLVTEVSSLKASNRSLHEEIESSQDVERRVAITRRDISWFVLNESPSNLCSFINSIQENPLNALLSSTVSKQLVCILSVFSDIDILDHRFLNFILSRQERSSYLRYLSCHRDICELLVLLLDDEKVLETVVFDKYIHDEVGRALWGHLWKKAVIVENTRVVMRLLNKGSSFLKNERNTTTERSILDLPISSKRIKYFKALYKVKHTEEMFEYVTFSTSPEWYEVLLEFI